jgi:hypothetical protein
MRSTPPRVFFSTYTPRRTHACVHSVCRPAAHACSHVDLSVFPTLLSGRAAASHEEPPSTEESRGKTDHFMVHGNVLERDAKRKARRSVNSELDV